MGVCLRNDPVKSIGVLLVPTLEGFLLCMQCSVLIVHGLVESETAEPPFSDPDLSINIPLAPGL